MSTQRKDEVTPQQEQSQVLQEQKDYIQHLEKTLESKNNLINGCMEVLGYRKSQYRKLHYENRVNKKALNMLLELQEKEQAQEKKVLEEIGKMRGGLK